jgi:uncharacterized protein
MDLYIVPFLDQLLIYRPLRHLAFVGNAALVDYIRRRLQGPVAATNAEVEGFLESVGFWRPGWDCEELPDANDIRPTTAVLLMTNRCNLRCIYCYADGGAVATVEELTWPVAQAVIEAAFANARCPDAGPPGLTFHGGGEPTLHWELLERCVRYARDLAPDCRVSMSSNGVWTADQQRFICEHFSEVSLSMDGLPEVQNIQRPWANGANSFPRVRESMTALDEAAVNYGVRMTVLPESVGRLVAGVRLLCEQTRAASIQVEPTFTSARGVYSDLDPVFATAFSTAFLEAWRVGVEAGRNVYYSGARPWVISPAFCLAPLRAIVATPGGQLMTCFEIFSGGHGKAGAFQIGRVHHGRVEYDRPALRAFLAEQRQRREACRECFCYWHCCGDCATRRQPATSLSSGRCHVTRTVTRDLLAAYIADGGGVWEGIRETPPPEGIEVAHRAPS